MTRSALWAVGAWAVAATGFYLAGALAWRQSPMWWVPAVVCVLAILVQWQLRCPRCGLHWGARRASGFGANLGGLPRCPRCGRDRRDITPFQYWFNRDRSAAESEFSETAERERH